MERSPGFDSFPRDCVAGSRQLPPGTMSDMSAAYENQALQSLKHFKRDLTFHYLMMTIRHFCCLDIKKIVIRGVILTQMIK